MACLINVTAVSWEDLKQYVYYMDGSWRDIYVLDATREDWRIWADLVNANYPVRFLDGHGQPHDHIIFDEVLKYWEGSEPMLTCTFSVGAIEVKCHFFDEEEIEHDIDPKQIDSYGAHRQLLHYMTLLSQSLGKQVVLTHENDTPARYTDSQPWAPLLAVDKDQQQVYAYWLDSPPRYGTRIIC